MAGKKGGKLDRIVRVANKDGLKLNLRDLATAFGVSAKTIKQWVDSGLPYLEGGGNGVAYVFDSAQAFKWKLQKEANEIWAQADNSGGGTGAGEDVEKISFEEAKRRREVALAKKAELDLAKELGLVANIDDLVVNFCDALVEVRSKIVSQSSRLSGILSHQEEDEISKLLTADNDETLESLSDYNHTYRGAANE